MREADDRHELDVVDLQELAVDRAHVEHERLDLIAGAAGEDDRIIGGDPGAEGRHDGADVERRGRGQRVQETLRAGDRAALAWRVEGVDGVRSEEHTSELQSLMRISYAVFCLKKKTHTDNRKLHE